MKHHDTETKEQSSQWTSLFLVTTEKSNLCMWPNQWDAVFFDYGDILHYEYVPQKCRLLTSMSDKFLDAMNCKSLKSGKLVTGKKTTMCVLIQPSECGNFYTNTVFQKQQTLHSYHIWLPVTSFCSLNLRKTKL
jgi:hypothetical protein